MSTENIVKFLQTAYSDEKLAAVLAHTENGKMSYYSCCCLIGIPGATHALQCAHNYVEPHDLAEARRLPYAEKAEIEFHYLGGNKVQRREKLLPLIYAEIAVRDQEREEFIRPDTSGKSDESEEPIFCSELGM